MITPQDIVEFIRDYAKQFQEERGTLPPRNGHMHASEILNEIANAIERMIKEQTK